MDNDPSIKSLNILFFLHYPNPFPEAAWRRIEFFAEYFQAKGHEVTIVGAFSYRTLRKAGSRDYNRMKLVNLTPLIMMTNIISLAFNIISSLISSILAFILVRPDMVIISVPVGETAVGPFVVSRLFRTKRVVTDYRDEWEDYAIKISKSRIYKKACRFLKVIMTKFYSSSYMVMATTESMATGLSSRGLQNIRVVKNGADTRFFKPYDKAEMRSKYGLNKDDFILVYSGFLGGYYRLDLVIQALAEVIGKKVNIKFLIMGSGDLEIQSIKRLAREKHIFDNIIFLGSKSDKTEIAEILSAADLGIIPYDSNSLWKNTLPVKSLEYLACGLPILATAYNDSVLGELILKNKVGFISEPENVEALTNTIQRIFANTELLIHAHKMAVKVVDEQFDRNKIVKNVYTELVSQMPN